MAEEIKLPECICLKCGYKWIPRVSDPRMCPNPDCRTMRWDLPRKDKGNGDTEVFNA
jgi:hypothetical protein